MRQPLTKSTNEPFFSLDVWRRGLEEKRRSNEARRLRVLEATLGFLGELFRRHGWTEAYVFGSLLRPGEFHEDSDVDVAVGGMDKLDHYRLVAELSSRLQRGVDVVLLEECRFAERIRERGLRWTKDG